MNIDEPPQATAFTSNEVQKAEEKTYHIFKMPSALVILSTEV